MFRCVYVCSWIMHSCEGNGCACVGAVFSCHKMVKCMCLFVCFCVYVHPDEKFMLGNGI